MSCEEAKAELELAKRDWGIAFNKHMSLVNPGGLTVVDEAGSQAIERASQEFAAADRRLLTAIRAHLVASASHSNPSN